MPVRGAVACGHPLTAAAAEEVLLEGGNAFDAIIAAQLTACVAEPVLASLGGGGFLLAQAVGAAPCVVDFFAQTPKRRAASAAMSPVQADFGPASQTFHIGLGSTATPGCVAGVYAIHQAYATLPMSRLAEPAINAARHGVVVNDFQGYIFDIVRPIYEANAQTAEVYSNARTGMRLQQPALADTLEQIVREGARSFYHGALAAELDDLSRNQGGHLTGADLADYAVQLHQPFTFDYRGATLFTNPPPSAGGVLIALTLKVLETLDVSALTPASEDHLRVLCDAMTLSNDARTQTSTDVAELLRIYQEKVATAAQVKRGTTHISVIDAAGNSAALSLSNGEGCGQLLANSGIMLNNMLGEEDINPGGVGNWPLDTRLGSMMAPTLIQTGDHHHALGSGGSNRIRSAISQVISQLLDFATPPPQAVRFPRAHLEALLLSVEAGFSIADLPAGNQPPLQQWESPNLFFGGVHLVSRQGAEFTAAGDPRRGGVGLIART